MQQATSFKLKDHQASYIGVSMGGFNYIERKRQ